MGVARIFVGGGNTFKKFSKNFQIIFQKNFQKILKKIAKNGLV